MLNKKEYLIIFIIMVTETLGFSLILPFLPFYAQELGASPVTIGLILSSFSLFQFFSAPIMGRLSDIYGRKPLLILSQISTLIGFVVLGFANTLLLVFISRIIDGALGSNFTIAQAYLSDVSSKEDRSKAFGISGAAFGFGFLIGPALGGFLAEIDYSLPAFIAAGVTMLTILTTHFFLKETIKVDPKIKFKFTDIKLFDIETINEVKNNRKVTALLILFITYIVAHAMFVNNYALYGERKLGFGVAETGYVLTFVGLTNVIIRGFLLNKLIDLFGEKRLQTVGTGFMLLCFLILSLVEARWLFYISIIMFALGSGLTRPLVLGDLSRNVSDKKQGALMGIANAFTSITQIITPLIGGLIINYMLPGYLPLASFIILLVGIGYLNLYYKKENHII